MKLKILKNKTIQVEGGSSASRTRKKSRGQSLVEMALLLPLLVILLSVVVEGGLALNAWIRVNTAARDGTRFALDRGLPGDTANLILYKLKGVDFGSSRETPGSRNLDIFQIVGSTNSSGNIPNTTDYWKKDQIYNGDNSGNAYDMANVSKITNTMIETRLRSVGNPADVKFVIVEVSFSYTPLLGTLIAPGAKLPMTSYAIIQQEPNN